LNQKRFKNFLIPTSFLFCLYFNGYGQEKTVNKANQQWIQYYSTFQISELVALQGDVGYRWKDALRERSQYIVRLGAVYRLNAMFQLGGGFAHLGTYDMDGISRVEFRPYQDISMKHGPDKAGLTHRFRVEERFTNPVIDRHIEGSNTFSFRFRYALNASIPLFGLSKNNPDYRFVLNIGDELFLNSGKSIVTNVFDQNRMTVSPTVQWSKNFSVSLTWSNQFASTQTPDTYLRTRTFWLQIRQRFTCRQKSTSL